LTIHLPLPIPAPPPELAPPPKPAPDVPVGALVAPDAERLTVTEPLTGLVEWLGRVVAQRRFEISARAHAGTERTRNHRCHSGRDRLELPFRLSTGG
jgi:hypothetical protein